MTSKFRLMFTNWNRAMGVSLLLPNQKFTRYSLDLLWDTLHNIIQYIWIWGKQATLKSRRMFMIHSNWVLFSDKGSHFGLIIMFNISCNQIGVHVTMYSKSPPVYYCRSIYDHVIYNLHTVFLIFVFNSLTLWFVTVCSSR